MIEIRELCGETNIETMAICADVIVKCNKRPNGLPISKLGESLSLHRDREGQSYVLAVGHVSKCESKCLYIVLSPVTVHFPL